MTKTQALWEYYGAAAAGLGLRELPDGTVREENYSVRWYFDGHGEHNVLTRAFLGDSQALETVRRGILHPEDREAQRALYGGHGSAEFREEDFLEADSHNPPPDEYQAEAIKAALRMPVSFIKGPPGSGKTSGILHLLSCVLRQGMTAAMVSSNNTAIASVCDKINGFTDTSLPKQQALKRSFARLGSSAHRRAFEKAHKEMFAGEYGSCAQMPAEVFLKTFPIVASTLNSLPKCFLDWRAGEEGHRTQPVYDYVIVDESSQVNAILGLIAMGGARHLVLVGDDDQLPPVVDEKKINKYLGERAENARKAAGEDFDDIYVLRGERSFLWACRRVFLANNVELADESDRMLCYHYRCHPGIIGFCRDAVYTGESAKRTMQIRTRQYDRTHPTPIRVVWFEGKYCESCPRPGESREEDKESRTSKRNRRQAEIFMAQEWPELLDRLCADPGTVLNLEDPKPLNFCVLSPYRGQLWELRDMLDKWLGDEENRRAVADRARAHRQEFLSLLEGRDVEDFLAASGAGCELSGRTGESGGPEGEDKIALAVDRLIETLPDRLRPYIPGEDKGSDPLEVRLPELTVHKVQGQEYDIVYFLPVDDGNWEWPWSQKKRLINVAVSRAKKELRIVASTAFMDVDIQRSLTGGRWLEPESPDKEDAPGEDGGFLRKLIRYVWDASPQGGPWTDGPFGFHKAEAASMFDLAAYLRPGKIRGKNPFPSGPEVCFQNWLRGLDLVAQRGLRVYTDAPIAAIYPRPEGLESGHTLYIQNGAHFDCLICRGERILLAVEVDGSHHRTDVDNRLRDEKKDEIVSRGFHAAMYRAAGGGLEPMEGGPESEDSPFDFLRLPTDGSAWNEEKTVEALLRRRMDKTGGEGYTLRVRTLEGLPEERRRRVFRELARPQDWRTGLPVGPGGFRENVRWVPTKAGTKKGLMMAYLPGAGGPYPTLVCRADTWDALGTETEDESAAGETGK